MTCRSALLALAVLFALTSTASANDTLFAPPSYAPRAEAPADEPETETVWYGYQTLGIDLAAWSLLFISEDEDALWAVYFAAPFVHAFNGSPGRMLGSASLRVGGTFIGMLAGIAASDDCDLSDCFFPAGMFVGALVGLVSAQLIDGLWISQKQVEKRSRSIIPTASVREGGATVGLSGSF